MDENMSRGYIQLGSSFKQTRILRQLGNVRPPTDSCYCIYFGLVLAGVGFLLPYNSFIIAVDYFQSRYPATTIVFDMSLVYILVAFGAVIINNVLVETLSLNVRIMFGYVVAFFSLLFVAMFEIWFDVFDLDTGYYINLLAVAVVAFGCTVQQSSFYGFTSMLPPRYTQAVMLGESAAGLIISTNRILTKLLLDDERFNTLLFFSMSIAIVVLCFVLNLILRKTEFVNFFIETCMTANEGDELQKRIILEPTEDVGLVQDLEFPEENDPWKTSCESLNADSALDGAKYRVQDVVVRMRGTTYTKHIQWWTGIKRGIINRWQVTKKIWPYMLTISFAYFVTLCLFPGIESEIVNCDLLSWMPVVLMTLFNMFDFFGKILASVLHTWTKRQLLCFSASRILLVPLIAMCAGPRGLPLIQRVEWPLLFTCILGLTNGIFGSVPMIIAPTVVPDEQKELTGNIMTLSYSLGLTSGSGIAYFIDHLLGPPLLNPCMATMGLTTLMSMDVENATSYPFNSTSMGSELIWNMTILTEIDTNSSIV